MAYNSFEKHLLGGRNFAKSELDILRELIELSKESGMCASRRKEFLAKLGL